MVINTNMAAQDAAVLLGGSSQKLSKSLSRLASGSKITSPADDSAGLGVSMRLTSEIGRDAAAGDNINNALSFSQTQDGYLARIDDALTRMGDLAIAAQDVTKTDSDRALYNQEFQTLSTYISNAVTKDFNGVSLFSGAALNVTIDSEGGTFAMSGISANYVHSSSGTVSTAVNGNTKLSDLGVSTSDLANGIQMTLSDGSSYSRSFDANSTINDLVNFLNSDPFPDTASATFDANTHQLTMVLGEDGFGTNNQLDLPTGGDMLQDLGFTPAIVGGGTDFYYGFSNGSHTYNATLPSTVNTNVPAMDISTTSGAIAALSQVKSALTQLAADRATVGANMERLQFNFQELETLSNNLSAANSAITDVDIAAESTNYARQNILVQSGTAMLAQANAMPQSVLKLIG